MALKYSDRPYTGRQMGGLALTRLPAGAQPMHTAPSASATPVVIYSADGRSQWALNHRDSWRKLEPFKDSKSGAVTWRMNGEMVPQPIAWSSQPLQRR